MNFAIARRFVDLECFVFLDESGAKTNMNLAQTWRFGRIEM